MLLNFLRIFQEIATEPTLFPHVLIRVVMYVQCTLQFLHVNTRLFEGAMATSISESDTEWWKDPATIQSIRHYAHMSGLLYCPPPSPDTSDATPAVNIAVTLQPSKFPKELFEVVRSLQPEINSLLDAVSRDVDFLKEALSR